MDNAVLDLWNKLMVNMLTSWGVPAVSPFAWFTIPDKRKSPWQMPRELARAISDSFGALASDKEPGSREADLVSELVSNLMWRGFDGYFELQRKWLESVYRDAGAAQDVEASGKAAGIWLENIRKLLVMVPNVQEAGLPGPSKDLLAKYAAFSGKMSELLYQVCLPIDKAAKAAVESMKETGRDGTLLQNTEQAGGVWLSALEDSYLALLRSAGYTQLLHETADAYEQYRRSRRQAYAPQAKPEAASEGGGVEALSAEVVKLREKLEELLGKIDTQRVSDDR